MRDTSASPNATAPQPEEPVSPQGAAAAEPDLVAAAAQEAAALKDKLLRALAEMENLRKRTEREVADSRAYAITAFARDILNVADNMHRALGALDVELRKQADSSLKALLDGVELTERELLNVLDKHGVKKLEPLGQKFDPNLHQAMYEVPDPSVPAGTIVQVVQAGYTIGDRVLRPALVAIAKGASKTEPPGQGETTAA
ncbi:MAG TPA: nucleotide exchange factor GrpE [Xanthobacteraceae bacterium]|nr:nucleotide exchange factor GrpE [Xanthobacteraceae bacterium]